MKHDLIKRVVVFPVLLGLAFAAMAQAPAPTPAEPVALPAAVAPVNDATTAAQPAPKDEVARKEVATATASLKPAPAWRRVPTAGPQVRQRQRAVPTPRMI